MKGFVKIKGYEDYLIPNKGEVYSAKSNKFLKPIFHSCGYIQIALYKNGERKTYYVHRLVILNFSSNELNKPCVNHINCIKTDNRIENLEWVTYKENSKHAVKKGKIVKGKYNICSKKVIQYTLNGDFIKVWGCIADVKRILNINNSNIVSCCKNKRNHAGNYKWKYGN